MPSHFLNQCWNIGNWTLRNKLPWNLNQNSHLSIQENVFENVVGKLAAILSRSQYARYLYVEQFLSSHTMLVDIFHTWKLTLYVLRENINIYLHFMSFLHTNKTQVVEIPPRVRHGPAYSTWSISWLPMSWRRKEPGHQQPWYWPS